MTADLQLESGQVFTRIVCGVNRAPESTEAVRQATRLAAPGASVVLVTALDAADLVGDAPRFETLAVAARVQQDAEDLLARAGTMVESAGAIEERMIEGPPAEVLFSLVSAEPTCLLAVGGRKEDRLSGILLGSVVTRVLHAAPCSILVARTMPDPERFPRSIVVGLDGSSGSALAYAAASAIADRLDVELRPLVALGGDAVDLEAVQRIASGRTFAVEERAPAHVLSTVDADLVVVGSRGLHGLESLGSVSERVAHRSKRSVLVVRPVSPPA